jgi:hypothetical protein
MVLDGKEHEVFAANEVENEVVVHDELANLVAFLEPLLHPLGENLGLCRKNGTLQKRTTRQWEAADLRYDVVDELFKQAGERRSGRPLPGRLRYRRDSPRNSG